MKPLLKHLNTFQDKRGSFNSLYKKNKIFKKFNIHQVNFSKNTLKGTIRGLHLQKSKFKEEKIIYCLIGKIYDVVIDMRKNSKNFLKKYEFNLDAEANNFLYIPYGFAHGFQTLKNNCTLIYLHSNNYSKLQEETINPFDKNLKIDWPLKCKSISKKVLNSRFLIDNFKGFEYEV